MSTVTKTMRSRDSVIVWLFVALLMPIGANSQFVRTEMKVPDIPGYRTLKCDLHTHTVFSDGNVWPTIRVDEVWALGYDAISITDHIEYQPHKKYIPVQHEASYEIARPTGETRDIIVIRGSEVTRVMPPGHLNAIFLKDATAMETDRIREMHASDHYRAGFKDSIDHQHQDYMLALEEAINQKAFVFWNHPEWKSQAKDGIRLWDVHKELIQKGWLMGIEVANMGEWYPEAFQWCLDYNLTMLASSDIHQTEEIFEKRNKLKHRPVTLVFARERTAESIREALDNGRTAVWFNDLVMGRKEFLEPLCENAIEVSDPFHEDGKGRRYYNIRNLSDFRLDLSEVSGGTTIELPPQSTVVQRVEKGKKSANYSVNQFLIEPEKNLEIQLLFK
ncbi:MAG: histidinol-phosphatase [Bacteroidota bacterium]